MIENSIVGLRSQIGRNCVIRNTILMGQDFYQTQKELAQVAAEGKVPIGIGDNTVIDGAIIDKNCAIGRNVTIANPDSIIETPEQFYGMIRDGVVCVEKNAAIPDGTNLTGKGK